MQLYEAYFPDAQISSPVLLLLLLLYCLFFKYIFK